MNAVTKSPQLQVFRGEYVRILRLDVDSYVRVPVRSRKEYKFYEILTSETCLSHGGTRWHEEAHV